LPAFAMSTRRCLHQWNSYGLCESNVRGSVPPLLGGHHRRYLS
jgi:hypothetical protein